MRAFVTGADGFIGSHLVEALLAQGDHVRALALTRAEDSLGWLDDIPDQDRLTKVRGDIRSLDLMTALVEDNDIVFHLAAMGSVPYSFDDPEAFLDVNIRGSLNVAKACARCNVAMIHTSSSEVYGKVPHSTRIYESYPTIAASPYGASKVAAEQLVQTYSRGTGTDVMVLRPFNTYGPRQSSRAITAEIIRQALHPTIEVVALGNANTVRDFMFVDDLVAAYLLAADLFEPGVFNVGTGQMSTMLAWARRILELAEIPKATRDSDDSRTRDASIEVDWLLANYGAFHRLTGWDPRTEQNEGLRRTIEWAKGRPVRQGGVLV